MKEKDGNLKAGDKVMIRKDLENKIYGADGVVSEMLKNAGKIVTVSKVYQKIGRFSIEEDNWSYTPEMVEQNKRSETTTITIYNTPGSPKVSAVMRRGDTVIKSAKAVCNATDTFSLDFGTELAVKRLFGWEEKAKPVISTSKEVVAVTRHANPNEWIEIVNALNYPENNYKNGDVKQVATESKTDDGVYINRDFDRYNVWNFVSDTEYVVLENYHQETPVKFRKAKVGERIKIVKKLHHFPKVNIGDIFAVTETGSSWIATDKNAFDDNLEEYIILNR